MTSRSARGALWEAGRRAEVRVWPAEQPPGDQQEGHQTAGRAYQEQPHGWQDAQQLEHTTPEHEGRKFMIYRTWLPVTFILILIWCQVPKNTDVGTKNILKC